MSPLSRRASLLSALGLGACTLPVRGPGAPQADLGRVQVLGVPNERFLTSGLTDALRGEFAAATAKRRAFLGMRPNAPFTGGLDLLAISGGGEDGAFGAGLITAWPNRPQFNLVTGISTGALTAPFAFLGPDWDEGLRRVYTGITLRDVAEPRNLLAALFDDALADSSPLFRTISRELDERMLAAIGQEYRNGRLLLIGTTNLDTGLPVIWNVGAIAESGDPRALDLVRRILLASAAVPGAFPPVFFDVALNGSTYQEMHVDGGAVSQAFLYPAGLGEERRAAIRAGRRVDPIRAWVIRNGRLDPAYSSVDRRTLTIVQRAVSTMIAAGGYYDTVRIWLITQRDGIDFRVSFIGREFDTPLASPFDQAYMRALFAHGEQRMRAGTAWQDRPPLA